MRYYLGIDAGGTKTYCLAGDASGRVLGFGRAGRGNYEDVGVESARVEIERAAMEALREAAIDLDSISAIGMGVAGADLPLSYELLDDEIFIPLFGAIPRIFRNDSMAGLRGGTLDPYGIVIACGTGCVCAGRNRAGDETRAGGISEEFGDLVTGTSIGLEGLKAVWRAREAIRPPTLLTQKFLDRAHLPDVDTLFNEVYYRRLPYEALQPMAKLVFEAAREGDSTACDILEWGGRYLGEMVNAIARTLAMSADTFDVVMAGSVFKGESAVLRDTMAAVIHRACPDARLVMPRYEPVVGALLMGIEADGTIEPAVYETLSASLAAAETRCGVRFRSE